MITFAIGDVRLTRVVESEEPLLDPAEIYPDSTPADIAANLDWLAPRFYELTSKLLIITIQGFVIQSAGKTILVDTCVGDCKERRRNAFDRKEWNWLANLEKAGFRPDDIDVVVCTHFHTDHVGWNTRLVDGKWVPTFPKARYLFGKVEWGYWESEGSKAQRERAGDYIGDSVIPIVESGCADLVEMDHTITNEVALIPAPGHTPGHVCLLLKSNGMEAFLASDLVHTPLQCLYPHWSTRFCIDPDHSRRTRRAFLERHADTGILFIPAHFPSPSAGYVERAGNAFRFRYHE
jgi:glyoxylase-like metal-dependent hydrolase (beta-lactamase superfamily II)